jgi:hypothetical protein
MVQMNEMFCDVRPQGGHVGDQIPLPPACTPLD